MSEIQDIITNASIKAFNSGLSHGVVQERERIIKLLEDTYADPDFEELGSFVFSQDIIELIQKGQQ
jgi:hypothetical protein